MFTCSKGSLVSSEEGFNKRERIIRYHKVLSEEHNLLIVD